MDAEFYRKLVEESSDIATIIDSDGKISYVSPSVEHTLGYEPEELLDESGFDYQHPDDREAVAEAIEDIQANPNEKRVIETRFRRTDGSWCWIEATLQNRLDDPDIDGILVNSRDISERKRGERQYQTLAEEYETLLETVEDGIFFISVETTDGGYEFRFEHLNAAYEEQTGITTEDVQGKTPTDVFGDEIGAELRSNYYRCADSRTSQTYQEEVPVETGALFWQTNLAPVITDGEVTRIIGITRNVTERVKREQQLRNQKDRLDEFASVISHDLRNPLTVAQGRTELLAEECDSEHLQPIVGALDRMEGLIADTLTLARQGRVVSEFETIQLHDEIMTCWETAPMDEATIEIEDEITIEGDRSRLCHVFENLFRNAVKHGSKDVTVRIGRINGHGFYVEDDGPGIPEAEWESVFDPGYTSAEGGTGFGLAIVKRIAEAHGWRVDIRAGTNGGARFEFTDVELVQE